VLKDYPTYIDLSLTRIKHLLRRLGNPHLKVPPVIHIAGTNGKGSTLAFLRSILEGSGYRVHSFISPHLILINERINIAGTEIATKVLNEYLALCNELIDPKLPLTWFEMLTCAAFLAFSEVKADFTLLETGLGGRIDATNVVPNPLLTLITPISYDHQEYLGSTIEEISLEKAGIMKNNAACIIGLQSIEALQILKQQAQQLDINLIAAGQDYHFHGTSDGIEFTLNEQKYTYPLPSLFGQHQIENASLAIMASHYIAQHKVVIPNEMIAQGIQTTSWIGRLEKLTCGKYYECVGQHTDLWIDGAHNSSGAKMLAAHFVGEKIQLVIAIKKTKNIDDFLLHFAGIVDHIYILELTEELKYHYAEDILNVAENNGMNATIVPSIYVALSTIENTKQLNKTVLITGSLYLIADVLRENH
jgi:dihydrofolate synthase / folylpolyglutamate synthase